MNEGWQFVVEDASSLSGPAVAHVIRSVADVVKAQFVVVDEVEGTGPVRLRLVSPDLLVFSVNEVAELAGQMTQLEWGDFFFLQTEAAANRIRPEDACPVRVVKSLVTVRCVDNTYFYVYGLQLRFRKAIQRRLRPVESRTGPVDELDYPR
jgi:hypothetical protein